MLLAVLWAIVPLGAGGRAGAEPIVETQSPLPEYVWTEVVEAERGRPALADKAQSNASDAAAGDTGTPTHPKGWQLGSSFETASIAPVRRTSRLDIRPIGAGYHRPGPPARFNILVTFFSALAVLLIVVAWRRPSAPPPNLRPPPGRGLVCLSCSRCDRVVDIPADRLGQRLFCPRCGTALSA